MVYDRILVLDFGGQYNQLIARRVRECGVYSEIRPYTTTLEEIRQAGYKGIILTGGPRSVNEKDAPRCSEELFSLGIPVLGICYGAQLMAVSLGGKVAQPEQREYGRTEMRIDQVDSLLFANMKSNSTVWMSHTDAIVDLPAGFARTAFSGACPIAALEDASRQLYAVQFHPEVNHTEEGQQLLRNFVLNICQSKAGWSMRSFAEESIAALRTQIGQEKVLCALSGGVDSSVAAVLLHRAIGENLTCIFVDHGLLRKNEGDEVEKVFRRQFDMNLIRVNVEDLFLEKLAGIVEPEQKRKIIGEEFIRVFEAEAKKIGHVKYLVQGTIYPDVIESGVGDAAVIKSHHNVGGLPDHVDFDEIIEPLRDLFKDEVRAVGEELGIPADLVWRQPFPGPGLGIRIIGDVTREKLEILKDADAIMREEIANSGMERSINQYFTVLTNMRSVGVMGDERSYDYTVALRAVTTSDLMTADWARLPYDLLERISNRIVNEVRSVNRIVYDVTSKPPATIEWE